MTEQKIVTDETEHARNRTGGTVYNAIEVPSIGGESVLDGDSVVDPNSEQAARDPATAPGPVESGPVSVGSAEPLAISVENSPPVSGAGQMTGGKIRLGDRIFGLLTAGSAVLVIALVVLVAIFLLVKSVPSITANKANFFSNQWDTTPGDLHFGVANLLWVTIIISVVAMVIAVPIAIGIALFITQYAPKRLARPVAYTIDLLAAIPSIVYGIWGYTTLSSALEPVQRALNHLGFIPLFKDHGLSTGTIFDGGVVLAVMILPIITAISRDVFDQTPRANIEAAWALGATRWEMIRMAVLPYGRPGVISGSMLGLGRALGETIAIALILSKVSGFNFSIFNGGETFASKIANNSSEFNQPLSTGAYIAAGLVLFVLTFVVNAAARAIVNRRKEFS